MMNCVQCGQPLVECQCAGVGAKLVHWSAYGNYADWTPNPDCGSLTVDAAYPKPSEPKVIDEAEQARLWDLLKQAAGG